MAISCSNEPVNDGNNTQKIDNCGIIVSVGEDQRGDYIEVRMLYHSVSQKDRYKVVDYKNYDLGEKICDFSGLTKQQL